VKRIPTLMKCRRLRSDGKMPNFDFDAQPLACSGISSHILRMET
jgi:hypothetical protein